MESSVNTENMGTWEQQGKERERTYYYFFFHFGFVPFQFCGRTQKAKIIFAKEK